MFQIYTVKDAVLDELFITIFRTVLLAIAGMDRSLISYCPEIRPSRGLHDWQLGLIGNKAVYDITRPDYSSLRESQGDHGGTRLIKDDGLLDISDEWLILSFVFFFHVRNNLFVSGWHG